MYIWNTAKLREELKSNTLSETSKKNYYIVVSIITLLTMYGAMLAGAADTKKTVIEFFISGLIMVVGMNLTFKTNGGTDYIARVVVLSVPLLIKIHLVVMITAFAFGILGFLLKLPEHTTESWFALLATIVSQVAYFWRLNVHLAKIKA